MKTLEDIKQQYARENNFCEWSEILYSTDDPAEIDEHFDNVSKIYAIEVAKEALKNAGKHVYECFKNVLSEDNIPKEVKL